ncbi:carbohydrate kinase family protein [Lentzea sp. HUAS TT2]|uniref:carbohydrate kinase family protein n=1 Tax=Lentzea sp. HUAS TT2 TaxID=3447454 RepID=UPI003F713A08
MRLAVTGSIATDHLMVFPGRFTDQLLADRLDSVSLSFLVDTLEVRRGGVAANISFGLGLLGSRPVLVGAVGQDFAEYRVWLEDHGVDTESVLVSRTRHTARFLCTTDDAQNQIASFYTGAMAEARDIALAPVADRLGGLDLVLVSPNDPDAMLRHTEECVRAGHPFAADPSQQLTRMDGDQIRSLLTGATWLFTNDYEHDLLLSKTGWSEAEVLDRVGAWITTMGEKGVRLEMAGLPTVHVPAVAAERVVDPTGVGDGFRAGFLAGLDRGFPAERSMQLGCTLATFVLESQGSQEYSVDPARFTDRFAAAYGPVAAAEADLFRSVHSGQFAR